MDEIRIIERQKHFGFGVMEAARRLELLVMLSQRQIASRYRQMLLGVFWAALEPLGQLLMLTLVFGFLLKVDTGGYPYPLFAFAGLTAWWLFSRNLLAVAGCLQDNMGLISKVYFPRLILALAASVKEIFDIAIMLVLLLVVTVIYGYAPGAKVLVLIPLLLFAGLLSLGLGLWLASLMVRFRDVRPMLGLILQAGMYASPKVVLVTGAGGSIGSELCRQILVVTPAKLLLIEQSEFALYAIHQELEEKLAGLDGAMPTVLVPLLASVQDDDRMREIMSTWHPDTVYHAAAYKHVPLVEHNPAAGIKNNVLGTLRTAQAAAENGVSDFVLISTDKAVRPTNVMGASKRLAEMVLQALAATQAGTQSGTKFSMVRFGNVLGSSGSVVPKFRQQIRDGGFITLTHPEVTRYFMTIPEAAQLVIQAGAMAKGGDVFVLDMGQPVKIIDLARRMVELSGLTVKDEQNPEGDIEIAVTGLRPGEKLYEELLIGDNPKPTVHPRIMKAHEEFIPWAEFEAKLNALEMALNVNDVGVIRLMMQQLVVGYTPSDDIVDWVYLELEAEAQAFRGGGRTGRFV